MCAARPLGWWEGASITASSRGDGRKSSPPEYCCCSCPITCCGSMRFLQSADAQWQLLWGTKRNIHQNSSMLENPCLATSLATSCSTAVVKAFFSLNGKLQGNARREAALQLSMLCIYYALITQLVGIAHLLAQMNTIPLQTGFRITGDKKKFCFFIEFWITKWTKPHVLSLRAYIY